MNQKYAQYLIKKVTSDYNKIADKFAMTRWSYMPKDLTELGNDIEAGEKVLDLGCGNGRFYEIASSKQANYTGCDSSQKLLEFAREKYSTAKFDLVEPLALPYENDSFDKIFCLAVFHHLPSKKFRLKFLGEAKRVLKPSGKLYLTVWDLNDKYSFFDFLKFKILNLNFDWRDIWLSFTAEKTKVNRYIHIFTLDELKSYFANQKLEVVKTQVQKRGKLQNYLVISQKI